MPSRTIGTLSRLIGVGKNGLVIRRRIKTSKPSERPRKVLLLVTVEMSLRSLAKSLGPLGKTTEDGEGPRVDRAGHTSMHQGTLGSFRRALLSSHWTGLTCHFQHGKVVGSHDTNGGLHTVQVVASRQLTRHRSRQITCPMTRHEVMSHGSIRTFGNCDDTPAATIPKAKIDAATGPASGSRSPIIWAARSRPRPS